MVRINRVYTGVGDGGETHLGDGRTAPKHSARVEAYGTVDEANAAVGLAIVALGGECTPAADAISVLLASVQNDLFDVGADLSVPIDPTDARQRLRVAPEMSERLEREIDRWNDSLAPLESFVLPGGTSAAAHLHVARTVVRRAERCVAALMSSEPARVNPSALVYLNRLSDLLFVLARAANDGGRNDVLWVPGAHLEG